MFDKCPKCAAFTLVWEADLKRYACIRMDCGYKSTDKKPPAIGEKEIEDE